MDAAIDLGYRTVVVDDVRGPSAVAPVDRKLTVDLYHERFVEQTASEFEKNGIIPSGVLTFFELAVEQTAQLAAHYRLPGNSADAATRARDKYRMREALLAGTKNPVRRFRVVESGHRHREARNGPESFIDEVVAFLAEEPTGSIVLKPRDLGASTGVMALRGDLLPVEDPARRAAIRAVWDRCVRDLHDFEKLYGYSTRRGGVLAESMIPPGSPEFNVDMLVHEGKPYVLAVGEKFGLMDGPTFREDAYVFPPHSLVGSDGSRLIVEARAAVRALGLTFGAVHLEAKMSGVPGKRIPWVVELAARCGGDLEVPAIQRHCGMNLWELVIKQAVGDLQEGALLALEARDADCFTGRPVAARVVYAAEPGRLVARPEIPRLAVPACEVLFSVAAVEAGYDVVLPENDYLAAVLTTGRDPQAAVANVNRCVEAIDVRTRPS